jgi:hypothetical protein
MEALVCSTCPSALSVEVSTPSFAASWSAFTSCVSAISASCPASPAGRGASGASRGLSETGAGVEVEVSFLITGSAEASPLPSAIEMSAAANPG